MQTYTQGGYSPQQQQLAQGQPNAVNSMPPPGSPSSSYGSDEALNSKYAAANASMMTANSPDTRQQLVNNSNIPAMQSNYDDLARQLFEYDQGVLSPKFQGTNPGTPTDAPAFGRVEASPLGMTMESAGLSADKGLYNPNPKYAYAAQTTQGNSILDLLDKLIGGINSGMTDVKGKNASNVAQAQSAIDQIYKIMSLKEDARQKELDRAERAADRASVKGDKTNDKTQAIWDQIYGNATGEYDIWKAINENQDAWRASGVDVDQLWRWHKNLAGRIGKGGATGQGLKEKLAKMPAKEKETVITLQTALDDIKRARAALDKTKSGPQYQAWQVRQYVPGGLGDGADMVSTMASVNKNLFKVAGTAFTKTEKDLISGSIVDPAKDIKSNKAALDEWERSIVGKLKGYGIPVEGKAAGKSTNTKDPLGLF